MRLVADKSIFVERALVETARALKRSCSSVTPPHIAKAAAYRDSARGQGPWKWFTEDEAVCAKALANIIVPSDDETPGLDDIDVLGPAALHLIDKLIAGCPERQRAYSYGLLSFDLWASKRHGAKFAELFPAQQTELFAASQRLYETRLARGSGIRQTLQKLSRTFSGQAVPLCAALLYPIVRSDCLEIFYASRVSWVWLEYDGPPMDEGYPRLEARK